MFDKPVTSFKNFNSSDTCSWRSLGSTIILIFLWFTYMIMTTLRNWLSCVLSNFLLFPVTSFLFQGFLDLRLEPWIRNMLTRCLAIVPSLIVAVIGGSAGAGKLIIIASVRYLCHWILSNFFVLKYLPMLVLKLIFFQTIMLYKIMEVSHIFVTQLHCGHIYA